MQNAVNSNLIIVEIKLQNLRKNNYLNLTKVKNSNIYAVRSALHTQRLKIIQQQNVMRLTSCK